MYPSVTVGDREERYPGMLSPSCTRGSLRPHLIRAWLPVVIPDGHSGASRAGLGWAGRPAHELLLAGRAHERDTGAGVVAGRRHDGALGLAVGPSCRAPRPFPRPGPMRSRRWQLTPVSRTRLR
jgi:hypothetical protein